MIAGPAIPPDVPVPEFPADVPAAVPAEVPAGVSAAPPAPLRSEEVLILAPNRKDANVTADLLSSTSLSPWICATMADLVERIRGGAGAAVFTDDALSLPGVDDLRVALAEQPAWSELPLIVLVQGGDATPVSQRLRLLGSVTLLERPVLLRTLLSAVQTGLRARRRQYEVRDQMIERERLLASERAAREQAEGAGRIKDEFLATLSHELRTPLNAILGWAQILAMAPGNVEDVRAGVEVIERNARAQTQLIEDLLDMSRIVSGKLTLERQPLDPVELVHEVVSTVLPAATAGEVVVDVRVAPPVPSVSADPHRLQQVVWNLLTNAIKFTPRGGRVTVEVRGCCRGRTPTLQIAVADTGQGIAADFLPHIFERFRQADGSSTRRHGGLGIGLSIVRQLTQLHGGTISVASDGPGRGARFTVSLPAIESPSRAAAPQAAMPSAPAALAGVSVLVVDDDPDARHVASRMLAGAGASVRSAASGADALALLATYSPDLLLSDIAMPEMDGYQFLAAARAHYGGAAVALSAFARAEDHARSRAAGYAHHVVKPFSAADLIATVATHARHPLGSPAAGPSRPDAPASAIRGRPRS
jgi:signal transduction histidine kinase/ActR/RegA family two-component response regulator